MERQEVKDNFRVECQLANLERNTELANHCYAAAYIIIEWNKDHKCKLKKFGERLLGNRISTQSQILPYFILSGNTYFDKESLSIL